MTLQQYQGFHRLAFASSAAGRNHEETRLPATTVQATQDLPGPLQRFGSTGEMACV
jgi:hypothetical protein